jgi:hypothetical protein
MLGCISIDWDSTSIRKPGQLHTVYCNLCPLPLRVLLMESRGRLSAYHIIIIVCFDVLKLVRQQQTIYYAPRTTRSTISLTPLLRNSLSIEHNPDRRSMGYMCPFEKRTQAARLNLQAHISVEVDKTSTNVENPNKYTYHVHNRRFPSV